MSFDKVEHDLHRRRKSRNNGVGLLLGGFVLLIVALTYVKITSAGFALPEIEAAE